MIINSVVIPPTSLEMAIPQKDSIVWTVQSITREILHLNNNKMFIFLFENAGNYWLNAVFQTIDRNVYHASKLGIIFNGWAHRYQTPTFKEACNACVRAQSMCFNLREGGGQQTRVYIDHFLMNRHQNHHKPLWNFTQHIFL